MAIWENIFTGKFVNAAGKTINFIGSDPTNLLNPYKTIPHFQKLLAGRHLHYLQFRVVKIKTAENTLFVRIQGNVSISLN